MTYFDTSYLVRLYWADPGFAEVRQFAARAPALCCARHGLTECLAAFQRKCREGVLSLEGFNALLAQFERDCAGGAFQWLPLDEPTFFRAEKVIVNAPAGVFLRAADALHLAAAAGRGCEEIYSNDRHLLAAAPLFGLRGVDLLAG